jgi:hypothetical protein
MFVYLLGVLYYGVRTYSHIGDLMRYSRVMIYSTVAVMFIYFFARAFN